MANVSDDSSLRARPASSAQQRVGSGENCRGHECWPPLPLRPTGPPYVPGSRVQITTAPQVYELNRGANCGGMVAGPIFARIAEKAAQYLDLAPQPDLIKPSTAGRVASTSAPGH